MTINHYPKEWLNDTMSKIIPNKAINPVRYTHSDAQRAARRLSGRWMSAFSSFVSEFLFWLTSASGRKQNLLVIS